jgi:ribose-phosphate pyrophosphokinase
LIGTGEFIDTGGSMCKVAAAVKANGAKKVFAACSHGVLSGKAIENLEKSPIDKLYITNSIPLTPEKEKCDKIVQLSIAEMLAMAIKKIHIEESLSILFR